MGKHISAKELWRFVRGELGAEEARIVVRHLLTECSECRTEAVAAFASLMLEPEEREPADVAGEVDVYDAAIDRALAKVVKRHLPRYEKERGILDRLLAALDEKPNLLEAMSAVRRRSHGGWPEVEAMLQMSFRERYRDRSKMYEYALFANVAAGSLDPKVYGEGLVADIQARTMGELANSLRLNDDFDGAESLLHSAFQRAREGTGDGLVAARLVDLSASLSMSQRRLGEALEMLENLPEKYHEYGETHLAGRALIKFGMATFYDDRPQEAAQLFRSGLEQIDEKLDPQLATTARHNFLLALVESGEYREAGRLLLESNLREAFSADPVNLLRLRWVEGKIFAGRRRYAQAERALLDVRKGFFARGEMYDAALAGLDLAALWLEVGKLGEVEELAEETLEVFRELEVHREAVRAVRYFRIACRERLASAALARDVARFIRGIEWHPGRRFAV
jgi:tetratricopeptide (TPR) repeat protein